MRAGPEGVWFGAGLNATTMMDRPYAIVVDGDGLCTHLMTVLILIRNLPTRHVPTFPPDLHQPSHPTYTNLPTRHASNAIEGGVTERRLGVAGSQNGHDAGKLLAKSVTVRG